MPAASYPTDHYNRPGAEGFLARLAAGTLVVQGPLDGPLAAQPGGEDIPATAWNTSEPQLIERLHALYLAAGADVLLTNTARANALLLEADQVHRSVAAVCRAAVDCARRAGGRMVLGSIGPSGQMWTAEDSPEYRAARALCREQAYELLRAGVDGLLLDGIASIRELEPALAGALDVADGMPALASFALDTAGNLQGDGLNIEAAAMLAEKRGVAVVGAECPTTTCAVDAAERLRRATALPLMIRAEGTDEKLAAAAPRLAEQGACLIGGLSDSTPRTCCALFDSLDPR